MKNSERLLSPKLIKYYLIFAIGLSVACTEEKIDNRVVAKVGSSSLSEEELAVALGSERNKNKYRDEFIRRWVETELLYQEALNENITSEDEYKVILEDSRKTIAAALLMNKLVENVELEIDDSDAEEYFQSHSEEFALASKAYVLNKAVFKDKSVAENFRYLMLEKGWDFAAKTFGNHEDIEITTNEFVTSRDISSPSIKRYLENISEKEISVIFQIEGEKFVVLQLLKRYSMGEIPEFSIVKEDVIDRLKMIKRKDIYKEFIDNLYSKYEVKIY